jgi:putative NADH-flavin reductase
MKEKSKIAFIGSTGKAGKYLAQELINQGCHFKALVRDHNKINFQSSSVEIIRGDVKDYSSVRSLLDGCHAVISTLGLGQPNSPTSIFSQSTNNILRAMGEYNIQRYIVITGLNVDTPDDKKSAMTKSATDWMKTNFPLTTTDKQLEYDILSHSNAHWTLVRLPLIEQSEVRRRITISLEDCPGEKIGAADLACFLIEQLNDNTYLRKAPFIASI